MNPSSAYFIAIALSVSSLSCSEDIGEDLCSDPSGDQSACVDQTWQAQIDTLVDEAMSASKIQGLTLAIVDDQQTLYAKGYGYADRATSKPVTPTTIFRVGSISKVFTATGVMQLFEKGDVNIESPLSSYLTEFSSQPRLGMTTTYEDIAPRHLLTHHSGLPSDFFHRNYSAIPPPLAEYTAQFQPEYLANDPDTVWSYSNSAYTILGHLIQEISGRPFSSYIDSEILAPLGMDHSSFELKPHLQSEYSKAYDPSGNEVVPLEIPEAPAGTLYSNGEDMARFMRMIIQNGHLDGERIIDETTLAMALKQQNQHVAADQLAGSTFGLGWFLGFSPLDYAGPVVHHGGNTLAFHSFMVIFPEQKLGVFVSNNTIGGETVSVRVAEEIAKIVLQTQRDLVQPEATTPEPVAWTPEQLDMLPGLYHLAGPMALTREGDTIHASVMGQTLQLQRMSDETIELTDVETGSAIGITMRFGTLEGQKVLILEDPVIPQLIPEFNPVAVPSAWQLRAGDYMNADPPFFGTQEILSLQYSDGMLAYVRIIDGEVIEASLLVPTDDDRAYTAGLGRGAGETLWIDRSGPTEVLRVKGSNFVPMPASSASRSKSLAPYKRSDKDQVLRFLHRLSRPLL